jgi:ribosome recycling factor
MNEEVDFVLDSAQEDMSNAIKHLEKSLLNIRGKKRSRYK